MAGFREALDKEAGLVRRLKEAFSDVASALFINCADAADGDSYRYEVALKRNLTEEERARFPAEHEGIPVIPYCGEPPQCKERDIPVITFRLKRG